MRKIIIFSILALFIFDTLGKENWITDFKHAQKIAAEEEKYILIDFSGSDWCGWCIKLDQEVFQTKIWKEYSDKYLVQVLIDFLVIKLGKVIRHRNRIGNWQRNMMYEAIQPLFY